MPSVEKTTRVLVRKVSRHSVPSNVNSEQVPAEVMAEALTQAGITEEDPRFNEFMDVAQNAGSLAIAHLFSLDTRGVTIEGESGRRRYLAAITPPPQGSNPIRFRP